MEKMKVFELKPEKIIQYLNEIYLYYSCTGLSSEQENITTKNLFKFFKDCKLSEQLVPTNSLEMIFISKKQKKKIINFEVFLEIIGKVSKIAYPDLIEISDSIYYFLDKHVMPLYNQIFSKNSGINELDKNTLDILIGIAPMLKELYRQEFP